MTFQLFMKYFYFTGLTLLTLYFFYLLYGWLVYLWNEYKANKAEREAADETVEVTYEI